MHAQKATNQEVAVATAAATVGGVGIDLDVGAQPLAHEEGDGGRYLPKGVGG